MSALHPNGAAASGPDAVRHFEQAFGGAPVTVGRARRFVRQVLAEHCDGAVPAETCDDAAVCVSELAANAVRHTRSGGPDGSYRVVVETGPGGRVHVEVRDQGADGVPRVRPDGAGVECGRGLWMCARLGVLGYSPDPPRSPDPAGRRVWVDLPHPAPVPASGVSAGVAGGAHGPDGGRR